MEVCIFNRNLLFLISNLFMLINSYRIVDMKYYRLLIGNNMYSFLSV